MYEIKVVPPESKDFKEVHQITFQFEKTKAVVEVTEYCQRKEEYARSFYVASRTDGYHWLSFFLAQEPSATQLIGYGNEFDVLVVSRQKRLLPWDFQGAKSPQPLKDQKLDGIMVHDVGTASYFKIMLLFEAFGFKYEREDKETCWLHYSGNKTTEAVVKQIAEIIMPRFALRERFYPDGLK